MRGIACLLGACVFAVLAGCGRGGAKPEVSAQGSPEDAVHSLFAALAAGDCAALNRVTVGSLARQVEKLGCAKALKELGAIEFLSVVSTEPDGRDPSARLLVIAVRMDGGERTLIVRADAVAGHWKVANL